MYIYITKNFDGYKIKLVTMPGKLNTKLKETVELEMRKQYTHTNTLELIYRYK